MTLDAGKIRISCERHGSITRARYGQSSHPFLDGVSDDLFRFPILVRSCRIVDLKFAIDFAADALRTLAQASNRSGLS